MQADWRYQIDRLRQLRRQLLSAEAVKIDNLETVAARTLEINQIGDALNANLSII